jgi:hypothetical protein
MEPGDIGCWMLAGDGAQQIADALDEPLQAAQMNERLRLLEMLEQDARVIWIERIGPKRWTLTREGENIGQPFKSWREVALSADRDAAANHATVAFRGLDPRRVGSG